MYWREDKEEDEHISKPTEMDPITDDDIVVDVKLGGTPNKYLLVEDCVMPLKDLVFKIPDYRKHVPDIRNMEMDEDDVIICAFAKAGTHWTWEITSMLLRGKAEYNSSMKVKLMMEFMPINVLQEVPKPRVFNTHFSFQCLPKQAMEKKCKIIFIHRNPKDILVSYLPFLQGFDLIDKSVTWDEFFDNYMEFEVKSSLLNWFYYTKEWFKVLKEKHDNIYCFAFEDLKENTVEEISKLAKFLGIDENKSLFGDIAERCSFENLKKDAEASRNSPKFSFRKGQVGDWKNYFTVAQNERFDTICAERLKDVDFQYRYTL